MNLQSSPGSKLIFFCGKMAAGKSTLARELASAENAVLLVQDDLLDRLFPGEISDVAAFVKYSNRVKAALAPHVVSLLARGLPVVLDFPANNRTQRAWFRELIDRSKAAHELHFLDCTDALCKRQLEGRSRHLPAGTPWTTEAEFDAVTAHFLAPCPDEGFNVIRHERGNAMNASRSP